VATTIQAESEIKQLTNSIKKIPKLIFLKTGQEIQNLIRGLSHYQLLG
jgi:hypothetical protein